MLKPPQRWAVAAAWVSVVGGLAPVVWRLHMLAWGAGWDLAPVFRHDPARVLYVIALCLVEGTTSLAVLGLVRPWGEFWPTRLPVVGGRRIPPGFVVAVAIPGAVAVSAILLGTGYALTVATLHGESNPVLQVHGWHRAFLLAHYGLWPLWPLGLWAAILGFARRWLLPGPHGH